MISCKQPGISPLSSKEKQHLLTEHAHRSLPNNIICRRTPDPSGNDVCSDCGACCARVLPIYKPELAALKKYIKDNHQLRKFILALNKGIPPLMCPFLDYTKPDHKCMIYDSGVLPVVCQHYTCNKDKQFRQLEQVASIADNHPLLIVDMWHALFEKATHVPDIADSWKNKDLLQDWGFTVPDEFLLQPNRLPEFFANFSWRLFITNTLHLQLPSGLSETEARDYLRFLNPGMRFLSPR